MATIKGQAVNDYQTAYQAGKLLGITQYQVNKWMDQYGGPGGVRTIQDGRGRKVHVEDIQTILDNSGEWPGEIEGDSVPLYESNPDEDGILYEYRIFVNGRLLEKWTDEPSRETLINNFGSGLFRVSKVDRRNGMTNDSQVYDCMNAVAPQAIAQNTVDSTLDTIKKLRSIDGNNGGGDMALVEMMRMNTNMMMGMLQQSNNMVIAMMNKNNGGGIKEALETVRLLRDEGLFDSGGESDATSELIKGAAAALPGLATAAIEKLTGKSAADIDLSMINLPEVKHLIPASAAPAAHPAKQIPEVKSELL